MGAKVDIALQQYRNQTTQIENLSRMTMSALEGFHASGYRTHKLKTLVTNINNLGLEYLDPTLLTNLSQSITLEQSKDTRDNLVLMGIGARAQQIFEMIIGLILRLLGSRGQRPADMDIAIQEEIKRIRELTYERITHTRLPEFEHPQFKLNWETQWSSYRDTIAQVDPSYKDMSPGDFYLNYKVPKNRDLFIRLGSGMMKDELPVCYLNGSRDHAFRRFTQLIIDTKNVISNMRYVEINPDGSVHYDQTGISQLIANLESAEVEDWDYTDKGIPDWLATITSSGVTQLRKIDGDMNGLENVTRLLSRSIRIDERISRIVNNVPVDQQDSLARTLSDNMRDWTYQLNTLVRLIGSIYSRIKNTEMTILRLLKQYRRTLDIIVKN